MTGSLSFPRRSLITGGAALAATAATAGRPRAQTSTKIVISQALLIANYTPVYLALQRGLFAKHGLDVDISTAGGIAVVIPVVLSRRAQFALSGSAPSVNATLEGGPMKCIAKIAGGTALLVLGRPGTVVKSLDDFKGKTIATLRFPSNTNTTPKYVFSKIGGFDPVAAGINFLEFPPGAQAQAVKDGRADFAIVFEWDASIGVTQFGLEVVSSLTGPVGPNASSTIFATDEYLAANGETAQHLVDAIAEGMKIIHTEAGAYEKASAAAFPQVPAAAIKLGSERLLAMPAVVPRNPIITKQDWDTVMAIELGSGGGLKQALPFERMVDNSYAEKATAAFGLPR
jgi:NitT/TauT family transport system substrate-binding protein